MSEDQSPVRQPTTCAEEAAYCAHAGNTELARNIELPGFSPREVEHLKPRANAAIENLDSDAKLQRERLRTFTDPTATVATNTDHSAAASAR